MLELTLSTLLNTIASDFCAIMEQEKDYLKAGLISFSMANDTYGSENVRKIIGEAKHHELKVLAVSSVISKCPEQLNRNQ
jgi:hypothetical protein